MKTISIVIPSYNSFNTISQTLSYIEQLNNYDAVIEVIVVDSSDDDKTKAFLENYPSKKVKIITSGVRVMPALQRNIGAHSAKGDILAFIDSDAFPDKDWVNNIIKVFEKGIKMGGGSYLLPDFQHDNKIAIAQYYLQFNEFLPAGEDRVKQFFPSCNIFCLRDFFNEVGGFPEVRASEDTLFCLKAGEKTELLFIPSAKVNHIFRTQRKAFYRNQKLLGKYVLIYRKDYYNSILYKGIIPLLTAPLVVGIKLFRLRSRIKFAGKEHILMFKKGLGAFLVGMHYWTLGYISGIWVKKIAP
jgi:glycosyltransferase involved in cell wall biosynthesis